MNAEEHNWQPLSPAQVQQVLSGLAVPWWIAGGWAIDLHLGRQTREHGDTDVVILRDDQLAVQQHLSGWDLHKTKQPGLSPWPRAEYLAAPINDIWCRRTPQSPWCIQFMLLDGSHDRWIFRRNRSISGPIRRLGRRTAEGIPYLAPEIQLLYKAKPQPLPKDDADLTAVLPCLDAEAREWLLRALHLCFGEVHPWIVQLNAAARRIH